MTHRPISKEVGLFLCGVRGKQQVALVQPFPFDNRYLFV